MAPSTTIRRLLKEVAELSPNSTNPNPAFYAAPVSDSNLHEWHFTLLGPPSPSPYAGGLYHGRISLPAQYPLKPPNFRFLTPSGRFEVNREICLSISGFHEETWMPAWGVRTALTALRSFMAEPGTAGQVGGLESSDEVRKRLAGESKRWKCNDCGRTNTEVMEEWWKICREQGVKVDEEDLGLEALPDGMLVEAIDRSKGKGKVIDGQTSDDSAISQSSPQRAHGSTETKSLMSEPSLQPTQQPDDASKPGPTQSPPPSSLTTVHSPAASIPSPTSRSAPPRSPSSSTHTQAQAQQQQPQRQPEGQAITLDRAITAIILALCIMIIKKIFYSSSRSGYGGASDDWDIGLSRDY